MTTQDPLPRLRLHYVSYDVYRGDEHIGLVFFRASDEVWVARSKHGMVTKHDPDQNVVVEWLANR